MVYLSTMFSLANYPQYSNGTSSTSVAPYPHTSAAVGPNSCYPQAFYGSIPPNANPCAAAGQSGLFPAGHPWADPVLSQTHPYLLQQGSQISPLGPACSEKTPSGRSPTIGSESGFESQGLNNAAPNPSLEALAADLAKTAAQRKETSVPCAYETVVSSSSTNKPGDFLRQSWVEKANSATALFPESHSAPQFQFDHGLGSFGQGPYGPVGLKPGPSAPFAPQVAEYPWLRTISQRPCGAGTNNIRVRTRDKYRMVYTDRQRLELEKEYYSSKYITTARKTELSRDLSLTERQIKIWFQNRRAKDRKQQKKSGTEVLEASVSPVIKEECTSSGSPSQYNKNNNNIAIGAQPHISPPTAPMEYTVGLHAADSSTSYLQPLQPIM